jgi:ABC-type polar amino acid transport system ATPase subunit
MDFGEIVEIGAPEEFFETARHERARQFLSQLLH